MDTEQELPAGRTKRPALRVIEGGGVRREERLDSRDAVARLLLASGVDLLLRRITPARAEAMEREVNEVLDLFDHVERLPALQPLLDQRLDALEALAREGKERRVPRGRLRAVPQGG
ncbi:MAG TPA: hypothetical protein VK013_04965 [Myxococcaceae bacterium]|nr:hypothetical protein [Myxococcaceae bacterium]